MENTRFKFRVWYTPIYSCEDDLKPHYVYDVEQIYDGFTDKGHSELGWVSSFGSLLDNEEYIVEQCTGLKDKNYNLIYEGDIVELDDSVKAVIEWDNDDGCWNIKTSDTIYTFANLYGNETRVIGNIHQNADLLEN